MVSSSSVIVYVIFFSLFSLKNIPGPLFFIYLNFNLYFFILIFFLSFFMKFFIVLNLVIQLYFLIYYFFQFDHYSFGF